MLTGIYSAASAMDQAAQRHELIARNLAHSDIPGYRRVIPGQQTFEASLSEAEQQMFTHDSLGTSGSGVAVDFTSGAMQRTGHPLDFAIQGDGFFAIDTPNEQLYTRNGAFQVDAEGRLVTADGFPVSGENGELRLPPNASPAMLNVSSDGTASVNGTEIGKLRLVRFDDPQALKSHGVTLFRASEDMIPEETDAEIHQGTREKSNVHPVQELVDMIATSRAHDAAQRAMKSLSQAIERHTNQQGS